MAFLPKPPQLTLKHTYLHHYKVNFFFFYTSFLKQIHVHRPTQVDYSTAQ